MSPPPHSLELSRHTQQSHPLSLDHILHPFTRGTKYYICTRLHKGPVAKKKVRPSQTAVAAGPDAPGTWLHTTYSLDTPV